MTLARWVLTQLLSNRFIGKMGKIVTPFKRSKKIIIGANATGREPPKKQS
jgi:hypothetical protein